MNLGEFKAWLAGYLESCSASPAKRVKRIEEKLAEVREHLTSVSVPIYRDRYVYPLTAPTISWPGPIFTTTIDTVDWTVTDNTITCENTNGTTHTVGYIQEGGD